MKSLRTITISLAWLACGLFSRGYIIGGFTVEFPAQRHDVMATMLVPAGPFVLPEGIYYALSGAPYMWRGYSCQQRWEEFKKDMQDLGKKYFAHWGGNYDCKADQLQ